MRRRGRLERTWGRVRRSESEQMLAPWSLMILSGQKKGHRLGSLQKCLVFFTVTP